MLYQIELYCDKKSCEIRNKSTHSNYGQGGDPIPASFQKWNLHGLHNRIWRSCSPYLRKTIIKWKTNGFKNSKKKPRSEERGRYEDYYLLGEILSAIRDFDF